MAKTVLVAAFPGCGKTYCVNNEEFKSKYKMLDSDSSKFSNVFFSDGHTERNPSFPQNYIDHINAKMGGYDIIFISTHEIVRKELEKNNIPYVLVFPDDTVENKNEFIRRYKERGNEENFIKLLENNWSDWIDYMKIEGFPLQYILGNSSTPSLYLSDVLEDIYELNSKEN